PDVKTAYELESQYNTAGIPAKCLHGGTPDDERQAAIREFKNKKIMVLINVSLFDEGFDLPAVEAVQDVAATGSFGRFVQRVGRALRLKEGKLFGRYVDHVGNIAQHCTVVTYADGETKIEVCHREWTLDRREKRTPGKSDAPPLRICTGCSQPFERFRKLCPYCGTAIPEPEGRTAVEFVDGDITELDPTAFAQMRADVARVDMSPQDYHAQLSAQGVPQIGIMANVKRHIVRQGVVGELRDVLAHWAGAQRAAGLSDGEIYRKFYLSHGVDMITCQTAKVDEMQQLIERVRG
ncbi:MAG: DEAD/DEAH box helicase, partial [Cetobacterium sp.]|uniref:DEAD/DEAH box helicase n=2 Tax=Bacteria TaxID=2 RepID=UPI003EE7CE45